MVIEIVGLFAILRHPSVTTAIDPRHAIRFVVTHGWQTFIVLGGVFLALTGAEAVYADLGHFGKASIRFSWYTVVPPELLLRYAGQTAASSKIRVSKETPCFTWSQAGALCRWGCYPQLRRLSQAKRSLYAGPVGIHQFMGDALHREAALQRVPRYGFVSNQICALDDVGANEVQRGALICTYAIRRRVAIVPKQPCGVGERYHKLIE